VQKFSNFFLPPCVCHYQYAAKGVYPNGDKALFVFPKILKGNGVWIIKNRECIGERDSVLGLYCLSPLIHPIQT
jgi:hypothetical protein